MMGSGVSAKHLWNRRKPARWMRWCNLKSTTFLSTPKFAQSLPLDSSYDLRELTQLFWTCVSTAKRKQYNERKNGNTHAFLKDLLQWLNEMARKAPGRKCLVCRLFSKCVFSSSSLPAPHLLCSPAQLEQAFRLRAMGGLTLSRWSLSQRLIGCRQPQGEGPTAKGASSPA